jgi:rare lipoprotein A (peptidoglycan hydrolase)
VNIAVTVALVPALFTARDSSPKGSVLVATGETLETLPVVATAVPGSSHVVVLGPNDIAAEAATTTTAPPPPPTTAKARRLTPTTAKPVARATLRPKTVPAPTTTAAPRPKPKPKPTPTTVSPADGTESGKASWYDHQAGICAHKSLPFGTVVTVTNVANGKSVQCTVGDRGPYVEGWVIDLNPQEFEQLAPRSTGVISVRLTW